MSTERIIVRGFHNRNEEPHEPIKEDRGDISNEEGDSEGMNITWVIWAFGIAMAFTLGISITSLIFNIKASNKLNRIEQYYEQGGNSKNISECSQSICTCGITYRVWQVQDSIR